MINFKGRHFPSDMILQVVRWYVAYSLSYRDIEKLMQERGIAVDHATLNRWVIYYSPLLEKEFRQHHKKWVGKSWHVDETYIKIKGEWYYLYRAIDKNGKTIDFMLSAIRDKIAAHHFFKKALCSTGIPEKIIMDKSGANKSGVNRVNAFLFILGCLGFSWFYIVIRPIKYLNNRIEQDHRAIKRIVKSMMGFKAFYSAAATLSGIELYRMLKKGQHKRGENLFAFEPFFQLAA